MLTEAEDYQEYLVDTASLYYAMKVYYNKYYIWATLGYVFVSFYSLIVTAWAYGSVVRQNLMNKDVRQTIFKKQMLYFIVLNFMEIPHLFLLYLLWYMTNNKIGFRDPNLLYLEAIFYLWFTCRGIVLPMLRLIEPSFAN